jgi:hypothetical protein
LNLLLLLLAIRFPPILLLSMLNVPVGLVIIGLLFVPRQYVVKRITEKFGAQLTSMGVGGVGLIVLVVCAKTLPRLASRAGRNPNLDFSNMGAIAGSLVATLIVMVIGLALWRVMGIARVLAAGYCLQLCAVTLMLAIGSASRDDWMDDAAIHGSTVATTADPQNDALGDSDRGKRLRQQASDRAADRRRASAEVTLRRPSDFRRPTADAPKIEASEPRDSIPFAVSKEHSSERHPVLAAGDPMADRIEAFRERNSREHTVVIKITRSNGNDLPRDVRLAMQKTLGLDRHYFSMFQGHALLLFVHPGPLSDIIDRLTIGEVLGVDEPQRTIEFRINALSSRLDAS